MLGFVLMMLAVSQLHARCRSAKQKTGGPMAILLGTWRLCELLSMATLYYLGVLPRIANFVSMLVGVAGGAVAYFSTVGTFPKKPQK